MNAEICFLMLMPLQSSIPPAKPQPVAAQKDTPYFFDIDIEFIPAGNFQLVINAVPVNVHCQALDRQVWLAECRYSLPDIFSETALAQNRTLQNHLKAELQNRASYNGAFIETYTILLFGPLDCLPDEFVQ